MKTPKFWYDKSIIPFLLYPISVIYLIVTKVNHIINKLNKPYKSNTKIIAVGNATSGGSGKTQIAIEIGKKIRGKLNFCYLTKGYGGKEKKFRKITDDMDVKNCGDEAKMLSEFADTFVGWDRKNAVMEIDRMGYDLIIMDDGMQNNEIYKDYNLLIIDTKFGFGNKFLIPAGPLRENSKNAIDRANAIILIGTESFNIVSNKPKFMTRIQLCNPEVVRGKNFLVFAGIGLPEKFFASVSEAGGRIIESIEFPDHYLYTKWDIEKIISIADKKHLNIITTYKDWVKIDMKYRSRIEFLSIKIEIDENLIKNILDECDIGI